MPNDLSGLLTRKIGPAPGWIWALGIGGAAFFVGPKLLKGGSSTITGIAGNASGFDPQSFSTGFSQGAQYQPAAPTTSTSSGTGQWSFGSPPGSIQWWRWDPAFAAKYSLPTGPQQGSGPTNAPPGANLTNSWQWWSGTGQPTGGGVGGAGARNRSASIGSVSADPHAYFHPSIKRVPKYPHFVRGGVGGAEGGAPIAHSAAVHQVAHQAEIHPARLQMLNPRPHRFIRVS